MLPTHDKRKYRTIYNIVPYFLLSWLGRMYLKVRIFGKLETASVLVLLLNRYVLSGSIF